MIRQARDFPAARTVSTTIDSKTEKTHMLFSTELKPTTSIVPKTLKKSEKKKIAQRVLVYVIERRRETNRPEKTERERERERLIGFWDCGGEECLGLVRLG